MSFDGFFIKNLITEIKPKIINLRLDRIYSSLNHFYLKFGKEYLVFNVAPNKGYFYLDNKYLNDFSNEFLKTLKKHLEGAKLTDIKQLGSDRIILFSFITSDLLTGLKPITLIFEAFGKDLNLILISNDNKIIDAYKKNPALDSRTILPNFEFEVLVSNKQDFHNLTYNNIIEPFDLVKKYQGISPLLAKYLFNHQISLSNIEVNPVKCLKTNQFYCFNIFGDEKVKNYETLSLLLQDTDVEKQTSKTEYLKFINKELSGLLKRKEKLESNYEQNQENLKFKEIADNIYLSNLDLNQSYARFEMIELDPKISLNQNAQKFYQLYKKAKSSFIPLEFELNKINQKIELFQDYLAQLDLAENDDLKDLAQELLDYGFKPKSRELRNKKLKNIPHIQTIKVSGGEILIGKNNLQNEYILTNLAQKSDLWFHIKAGSGGHVILNGERSPENMKKAAMFAAYFSSEKNSANIMVDYTEVRYLSKIKKLPGYKVTYRNYKTIVLNIDKDFLKVWNSAFCQKSHQNP